ncbi:cyclic-di-AMP receptor [Parvimonas micra]|uniref:cyclic-di-AMP receptor n=1 Tax=Parvimonas micra TaxID=33033 RepID=UPI0012397A8F|nr:cyclic-di-AMP receptor [Parvimonas micra]
MKLILAIIQDHIAQDVLNELSENKIRATKLSSTGGFFRKGNTTILIGIEEEKLDRVKEMILNISKNKETVDDKTANTVMFILNMDQFIRV